MHQATKQGTLKFLRWSSDGKFIVAAAGSSIKIWDQHLQPQGELFGHRSYIFGLHWLDAHRLRSASNDGVLKLWDVTNVSEINSISCESAKEGVGIGWSDHSDLLAILKADQLSICLASDGKTVHSLRTFSRCFQGFQEIVSWSADGRSVSAATSGLAPPVPIWDTTELFTTIDQQIATAEQRPVSNAPICWSPDGSQIAAFQGTINIRDAQTGALSRELTIPNPMTIHSVRFSPDGNRLAVSDGRLWIADLTSDNFSQFQQTNGMLYGRLCWSPSGQFLGAMGTSNNLFVVDLERGETKPLQLQCNVRSNLDWSVHDQLACAIGDQIAIINTSTGTREFIANSNLYHDNVVRWDNGGQRIAFSISGGLLGIVDRSTESRLLLEGHGALITAIEWNFDGTRLASLDQKGTIRVWDVTTGACVYLLPGYATGIAWAPRSPKLAVIRPSGLVQIIDASRSYLQECPPDLENDLLNGEQSSYRLAIQAARSENWKLAASNLHGTPCKPLGWWIRNRDDVTSDLALRSGLDWPLANSRWYAPYDFPNGSLQCVASESDYLCPLYSDAESGAVIIYGNLTRFASVTWNGSDLNLSNDSVPWRNRVRVVTRPGWNVLQLKTKPPLSNHSFFVDLLLTQDPSDIQFADFHAQYLQGNRSKQQGQGSKNGTNPLPEFVRRNLADIGSQ